MGDFTTLTNECLTVAIHPHGAEIHSIKSLDGQREYIWQADPTVWPRHAPILFPIVGRLRADKYQIGDAEYSLGQHGFARDNSFDLIKHDKTRCLFRLTDTPKTRTVYPFSFALEVDYRLNGPSLHCTYRVQGDDGMLFSIGAHPAFRCPIEKSLTQSDYFIEFSENETLHRFPLENALLSSLSEPFLSSEQVVPLTPGLFDHDAIVVKSFVSQSIALRSHRSPHGVRVHCGGWPFLGLWSKPSAPFVCIEPWYGVADGLTPNADLAAKEGMQSLKSGEVFSCEHVIEAF